MIKMTFQCNEDWEKMKIGVVSRYCQCCEKNVYDFTKMSKEEIILFLIKNRDKKICGRIYKSQIDYLHKEQLIVIQDLLEKNKNTNLGFYLLTLGTTILLSCSNSDKEINHPKNNIDSIFVINSENKKINNTNNQDSDTNSIIQNNNVKKNIDTIDIPVVGEIEPLEEINKNHNPNEPYIIVDKMPEFNGGIDSLTKYLVSNIKYPEWEKQNNIKGTVFVSFVVDKDGNVVNPEIIRSVKGSKNFDKEVLRVVSTMPKWIPGELKGNKVNVKMTLPVRFN
ncbi:MAG TPA: energy transducer TonB [Bacteroidia bacterium]|nr:energy transducer TonB [Bacteroidia bacterium]